MHESRFYDQAKALIEAGQVPPAMCMLLGQLFEAHNDRDKWPQARAAFRAHPLYPILLEDPFSARAASQPRGYPGDAGLIDMIYDRNPTSETSRRGQEMFEYSVRFPGAEAVRLRMIAATEMVEQAWHAGKRILVLACGHFREGDALVGKDLSNIVLVDQDALSLSEIRNRHSDNVVTVEANVLRYLRSAASKGEQFDLIYTLGLTDYLDERAMALLHRLAAAILRPGGEFVLANFLPNHLAVGWMDAVMEWHLIYRDEAELEAYAREAGLKPRCWRDPTDSIAWCAMTRPA
jgi:extracellular factor (EF) 3-hydroxypalmitic acid methyl ester biosynthesis protein